MHSKIYAHFSVIWGVYIGIMLCSSHANANPYPYEDAIQKDHYTTFTESKSALLPPLVQAGKQGQPILRVHVAWHEADESYAVSHIESEASGTQALVAAMKHPDEHGSFKARLIDEVSGEVLGYSTIGIGATFRKLTRELAFRLPLPVGRAIFEMAAEHPVTGQMEVVVRQVIKPSEIVASPSFSNLETRTLRTATKHPELIVNVYAEGYREERRHVFWQHAMRVGQALEDYDFPMLEHLTIQGVFASSKQKLGSPQDLGLPVPERDSFLGLYYPYWNNFGRYYHVVYPTRELKYRRSIGSVAYDYPVALVDSSSYWGVGNFKELTAIPATSSSFSFLLMHEIGHFFGLNEEYEGGGPTELAFAPQISEPWSQNITFQSSRQDVKWISFVDSNTPVPTPRSHWRSKRYGVYEGGYADTAKPGKVYKPGYSCVMNSGSRFCDVCQAAIRERLLYDMGVEGTK